MVIQGFNHSKQRPFGKIAIRSRFGGIEDYNEFLVINMDTSYNILLGRPWMHANVAIPSTYYQCVKYSLQGAKGTIMTNNDPFSTVEAYHAKPRFYQAKGKRKADDTDVPIMIPIRHPLVDHLSNNSPRMRMMDIYHRFEGSKKGN